jgi:PAS domain S-box-containing protein
MALSYSKGSATPQRVPLKEANRAAQATHTRSLLSILREPYLVQFTVFLVAYCIAGKLGQATTNIRSSNLGPVWPAYGIALAAFLVCGYRIWPAIALGSFSIAFFSPVSHLAALGQSAGATLAAFSGAFLLQRVAKFDKSLSRLRDALALVVLGALGSALVSASIGASVLYATEVHAYSGLGSAWLIYWLGDATGVLLITPLVLTIPNVLRSQHQARIAELAVLFVLLTAACFLIFGDPGLIPVRLHVLAFAVLPFVMWAAIRFGVIGAGLAVLLIATIATVETALGSGPFAISSPFTNAVLLGAFFAVLSVTGITLASVIAEREQAQREREQGVREQGALEARLEAEHVIRASEERLRLAQQAAGIGTFERNVQTGVLTWTPEMEALYGLSPGDFEKTQTVFENLIHPDDRARVIELVDCALKTGQQTRGEWRVVWPDGSVHWIAGRWQVLMNESGEPFRVVGVNMDVTARKRAEETLLEVNRNLKAQAQLLQAREELLRVFVKNVPAAVAMLDRDMRYLQVSDRWCSDNSVEASELLGRSRELSPEMPDRWKEVNRRALQGETLRADEDRWEFGGSTRWARWEVRPWRAADGTVGGILIFAEDITRRKQMEEAISGVSGRLIEAQERERGRIARDLHDDICQQLALVSIELEQVQRKLPDSVSEHRSQVGKLRKRIMDISTDVQMMSHELHSAKLSYLGAAVAMRGFCREFAEHHKFDIEFESRDVPRQLPPDVSLCLFRVLQEALHNAAKHSGVKRFDVQLWATLGEVHLTITDLGSGFDTEAAMKGRGLGITSMQERLKLVKGELTITSHPTSGTSIHARVPLELEDQSSRAAG